MSDVVWQHRWADGFVDHVHSRREMFPHLTALDRSALGRMALDYILSHREELLQPDVRKLSVEAQRELVARLLIVEDDE